MRDSSEGSREKTISWILDEVDKWTLAGVKVKIDGQFYSGGDSEIIEHVKEDNCYMENYVSDNTIMVRLYRSSLTVCKYCWRLSITMFLW